VFRIVAFGRQFFLLIPQLPLGSNACFFPCRLHSTEGSACFFACRLHRGARAIHMWNGVGPTDICV